MNIWFEAELVFERNGVGHNQIETIDLGEKVLFTELGVLLVSFVDVDPDQACEVLRCESELRPVFATVIVALIGGGTTKAEGETDDETEDGKKELIDAD